MISGDIHVYVLCSSLKWSSCLLKLLSWNTEFTFGMWENGRFASWMCTWQFCSNRDENIWGFSFYYFYVSYEVSSSREGKMWSNAVLARCTKWSGCLYIKALSDLWSVLQVKKIAGGFFLWPALPESISRSLKVTTHHKSHFRDTYCQRASSLCKNVILYCEWIITDETRAEKNMSLCCQIEWNSYLLTSQSFAGQREKITSIESRLFTY